MIDDGTVQLRTFFVFFFGFFLSRFCEEAQKAGMDVFRVFDSLNYLEVRKEYPYSATILSFFFYKTC